MIMCEGDRKLGALEAIFFFLFSLTFTHTDVSTFGFLIFTHIINKNEDKQNIVLLAYHTISLLIRRKRQLVGEFRINCYM